MDSVTGAGMGLTLEDANEMESEVTDLADLDGVMAAFFRTLQEDGKIDLAWTLIEPKPPQPLPLPTDPPPGALGVLIAAADALGIGRRMLVGFALIESGLDPKAQAKTNFLRGIRFNRHAARRKDNMLCQIPFGHRRILIHIKARSFLHLHETPVDLIGIGYIGRIDKMDIDITLTSLHHKNGRCNTQACNSRNGHRAKPHHNAEKSGFVCFFR